ncbi:MAG: hypothetical protein ACM3H8_09110 [Sphingobacteriales bacterium]
MEKINSAQSRKKFIAWGIGILTFFSIGGIFFKTNKKKKMIKMLSQDGKLVEIDASLLNSPKKKVTDKELQAWVKK